MSHLIFSINYRVFSHPPVGTVGLTEPEARAKYPGRPIKIYSSTFNPLFYAMSKAEHQVETSFKVVCLADEDERVLGIHMVGQSCDEILQGFAGKLLKNGC